MVSCVSGVCCLTWDPEMWTHPCRKPRGCWCAACTRRILVSSWSSYLWRHGSLLWRAADTQKSQIWSFSQQLNRICQEGKTINTTARSHYFEITWFQNGWRQINFLMIICAQYFPCSLKHFISTLLHPKHWTFTIPCADAVSTDVDWLRDTTVWELMSYLLLSILR